MVLLVGSFFLILLAFLLRHWLWKLAGAALVQTEAPQKADCILVLGGDEYGERISKAADLARAGFAPLVLVDGPGTLMGNEADTTIEYAVRAGYGRTLFEPVPLPKGVDSTSTELRYLATHILAPRHLEKVIVVTSNFHTARTARFIRRQGLIRHAQVIAAPDPYFSPQGWWKSRNGQKTFLLEWTKTVAEYW